VLAPFLKKEKMKTILLLFSIITMFFMSNAHAIHRLPQDIKLPSQKVLEYEIISNAAALDDNSILNDSTGAGAAASVTVSSFLAQPDLPRNILVTPVVTTADVKAGNVTVSGTDAKGGLISETFAFLANASTAVVGAKAFKSVTSIVFPQEDSPYGAKWDVGWGDKLGLDKCMDSTAFVIKAFISATTETITATASASTLASNGFTPTNVPDGALDYEILYVQNFRCY
jgi:hypothetical protein